MEALVNTPDRASVLIVDDNTLVRNVIQCLFQAENYDVSVAQNGHDALSVLEEKPVDVIVCDVMMPRMDGYELFEKIRGNDEMAHIPFVFLTALDSEDEVNKGYRSGCDGYLTKPFDPETLLSTVRGKVLRSRSIKRSVDQNQEQFRKRVLHTLSHEFRTPLVAINTGSEILLDDFAKSANKDEVAKTKKLIEAIHRGGLRLERLVNDFMLLQQIEAGVANGLFERRVRESTVGSVVNCFLAAIDATLKEQGFKIHFSNLCPDKKIYVYEPQIIEILKRVTDNAIKFSSGHREIDLAVYCDNSEVIISVADHGIGIDVAKVQGALSAFNQIDREKNEQQGGGLGLAIASRYAEINKGRLTFANREQGGAVVSLRLPLGHCPH